MPLVTGDTTVAHESRNASAATSWCRHFSASGSRGGPPGRSSRSQAPSSRCSRGGQPPRRQHHRLETLVASYTCSRASEAISIVGWQATADRPQCGRAGDLKYRSDCPSRTGWSREFSVTICGVAGRRSRRNTTPESPVWPEPRCHCTVSMTATSPPPPGSCLFISPRRRRNQTPCRRHIDRGCAHAFLGATKIQPAILPSPRRSPR